MLADDAFDRALDGTASFREMITTERSGFTSCSGRGFGERPFRDRREARQARRPADNAAQGFEDIRVALLKRAIRIGLTVFREAQAAAFRRRAAEVLYANRRLHPTTLRDRCRNRHEVKTLIRERLPGSYENRRPIHNGGGEH